MASEHTPKLNLVLYPNIDGVYQRELRQSYLDNFRKVDSGVATLETAIKQYVDTKLGEIENGHY